MIALLFWILFAFGCTSIAKYKGRSVIVWAVLGILFGIFALIVVALLPNLNSKS